MSDSFRIRVAKAEHVFSAAHFITIGDTCERLHGHNYHVAAELRGPLDEDQLVIDFLLVRATLRAILTQLDHCMLLPSEHQTMRVEDDGREVTVSFGAQRWVFPSGDCRLLPVPNTTAEMLAAYIGGRLLDELKLETSKIDHLRMEVDECDGQMAVWEW